MKTRNGFISNSSSSSFVVVLKEEHHKKALEAIHPYDKACIEALNPQITMFNGESHVTMATYETMGGSCWECIDIKYDGKKEDIPKEGKFEALNRYIAKVEELFGNDSVLTKDTDT